MFANSFDTEERSFKNRKTSVAAFVTIAVHALILLFLIFKILTPPDPPYTDSAGGVSVNFGTDATGSGDEQPMTLTPIQADFTPQAAATQQPQPEVQQEEVATQDIEDAPVVETKKNDAPKPKTETPVKPRTETKPNTNTNPVRTETPKPAEPQVDKGSLFTKGNKGNPNNSKGDGTGGPQGDQGDPSGDNSKDYTKGNGGTGGGPGGNGTGKGGVNLKGRKSAALPAPRYCDSKGNVIIDITVDRNGNVVDAKYHRDGSTITDNCSIENAKKAARQSKFNADADADEYQYGSINYVFTVQ